MVSVLNKRMPVTAERRIYAEEKNQSIASNKIIMNSITTPYSLVYSWT